MLNFEENINAVVTSHTFGKPKLQNDSEIEKPAH